MTLRLKACGRCGGDLALERDLGSYESWTCLQCGHEAAANGDIPVSRPERATYYTATGRQGKKPPPEDVNNDAALVNDDVPLLAVTPWQKFHRDRGAA